MLTKAYVKAYNSTHPTRKKVVKGPIDRESPLRRVVNSYQDNAGGIVDILECGHELKGYGRISSRRRCKQCAKQGG
jgi:hypothetical protein